MILFPTPQCICCEALETYHHLLHYQHQDCVNHTIEFWTIMIYIFQKDNIDSSLCVIITYLISINNNETPVAPTYYITLQKHQMTIGPQSLHYGLSGQIGLSKKLHNINNYTYPTTKIRCSPGWNTLSKHFEITLIKYGSSTTHNSTYPTQINST